MLLSISITKLYPQSITTMYFHFLAQYSNVLSFPYPNNPPWPVMYPYFPSFNKGAPVVNVSLIILCFAFAYNY